MDSKIDTVNQLVLTENACHGFKFSLPIPSTKNIPGGKLKSALQTSEKCNLKLELFLKTASGSARKLKIGLSKIQFEPHDFYVFFYYEFTNFRGEIFCKDSLEFLFSRNEQEISREVIKPTCPNTESDSGHLHYVLVKGHIIVQQCCKTVETDAELKNKALVQLQQDFKNSLDSGENADITLVAGNEQFRVHKFVLCSRSPVFRRMFTTDMYESRQNRIRIDFINSAVLKDFITFLYTGQIGRSTFDTTCELYSVGDKYEVPTLQESCRGILISGLSVNGVSRILKLADMHNDRELEDAAVKFICDNFTSVSKDADWKILLFDSPFLVSRTLEKVSESMSILN